MKDFIKTNALSLFLAIGIAAILVAAMMPQESERYQEQIDVLKIEVESLQVSNEIIKIQIEELKKRTEEQPVVSSASKEETFIGNMSEATWIQETGRTSDLWVYNNNAGGIKCYNDEYGCAGDYQQYPSKEIGYNDLVRHMRMYVEQFGMDVVAIRESWCQCSAEDTPQFIRVLDEVKQSYSY